ncbi:MAG: lysylphosphatidylglycerol synthase transmembrane domain-containing protein [Acidimicrobiales bacterium]
MIEGSGPAGAPAIEERTTSSTAGGEPPGLPRPSRYAGAKKVVRRAWPVVRWLIALAALALMVEVLRDNQGDLTQLGYAFSHLRWWWLPVAVVLEAASYVAFTRMQVGLLRAGGVDAPIGSLLSVSLASQAITNSLPGGTAVAAVYGFRWYRRFGADDTIAGWALVGTLVVAGVSLSLVAALGLALAAGEGASLDLIPVVVGVLVVAVAAGALFVYERPLGWVVSHSVRGWHRLTGRPSGDVAANIAGVVERLTVVRLGWREAGGVTGWGVANWLLDCGCFALCFPVIGAGVPWKGLLLAYGAGQLAANLPITPGGLGAVEGSITIALVAFGGARTSTVDAVLVYRLISFWGELLVGWSAWGGLALAVRRGRWPRRALDAPVELVATTEADREASVGRGEREVRS